MSLVSIEDTDSPRRKAKEKDFRADGLNPQYGFSLKRHQPSMPWVLTGLSEHRESSPAFLARFHQRVEAIVNRLMFVGHERLAELVKQTDFHVIGCRRIRIAGDELVQVDFDYPHEDLRRNDVQGGSLVLDSSRYWCLRSYNVRIRGGRTGRGTHQFTVKKWRDTDGFPVPVAATLESDFTNANKRHTFTMDYNYDLSVPDKLPPDRDFTLSAYDLPEPTLPGTSIPNYVWVAVVGVCCLTAGVLIRWRARRANQGGPS
jgi:hypothetical protein